jgi:hypothetical protein
MRVLCALFLLSGAGCRTRLNEAEPHEFYVSTGVSAEAPPALQVMAGQRVAAMGPRFDWYVEAGVARQWGSDDLGQIQVGARQVLSPGHRSHAYFRYGATWVRVVGDSDLVDDPGDYLGFYVGAGYEWDLTPQISVGPELDLNALFGESSLGEAFLPRFLLQLRVRF